MNKPPFKMGTAVVPLSFLSHEMVYTPCTLLSGGLFMIDVSQNPPVPCTQAVRDPSADKSDFH